MNDTVYRFDVPRGFDQFRVELEPDPEVTATSFGMRDGDEVNDGEVVLNDTQFTYRGKYYMEIYPDDSVELGVVIEYDHNDERTRAVDTAVTIHPGDELWMALRPGTSRFGVDR